MLEREMVDQFKIYPDEVMYIGDDEVVYANGEMYLLRKIDDRIHQMLPEKIAMAEWLSYQGENDIAIFLKPREKRNTIHVDGEDKIVYQIPKNSYGKSTAKRSLGKRLAQLHQRGYSYSLKDKKSQTFFSPWKERWERRLDQLEQWYVTISRAGGKSYFDEQFCVTFPYFLGLSENAIQMMADLAIDSGSGPQHSHRKTICHERFQEGSWLTFEEGIEARVKIPTDFTYDHYTRDIAEYIRTTWIENDGNNRSEKIVTSFLNHYESIQPLSVVDQRYLVARLLFPTHYYDKVESYYQTRHEGIKQHLEMECLQLFAQTADYERLIMYIIKRYPLLVTGNVIPQWLRTNHSS